MICPRQRRVAAATCLTAAVVGALLLLGSGCSGNDPLTQLIADLDDPARREHAIDGLLVQVRQAPAARRARVKERVVHALCEAYRTDQRRDAIVAALALLKDRRAEQVFVAALKDADRGGDYFEAAVRSARLIGELQLKRHVPALVTTLRRSHAAPRKDRNTWLERSLIQALDRLGDRRAVPALIELLRPTRPSTTSTSTGSPPGRWGGSGTHRAIAPLVQTLGAQSHGLLLFEENRRALCRIGPAAAEPLALATEGRQRGGLPRQSAAAALRVLGDLGGPALATSRLLRLLKPDDPDELRLALAEALLRRGAAAEGAKLLQALLAREESAAHRASSGRRAPRLAGRRGRPPREPAHRALLHAGTGQVQRGPGGALLEHGPGLHPRGGQGGPRAAGPLDRRAHRQGHRPQPQDLPRPADPGEHLRR